MTDPRFDPVFQRGYSGPAPELAVREQAPQAPRRPQAVPDGAAPLVAEGPAAEIPPSPAETILDSPADEPWQPPRRNPFALALLVVGVILIVIGVAMIWSVATQNGENTQTTFNTAEQALAILNYLLPPALLLGGILGVLGWLVLGAIGASRVREHTS